MGRFEDIQENIQRELRQYKQSFKTDYDVNLLISNMREIYRALRSDEERRVFRHALNEQNLVFFPRNHSTETLVNVKKFLSDTAGGVHPEPEVGSHHSPVARRPQVEAAQYPEAGSSKSAETVASIQTNLQTYTYRQWDLYQSPPNKGLQKIIIEDIKKLSTGHDIQAVADLLSNLHDKINSIRDSSPDRKVLKKWEDFGKKLDKTLQNLQIKLNKQERKAGRNVQPESEKQKRESDDNQDEDLSTSPSKRGP